MKTVETDAVGGAALCGQMNDDPALYDGEADRISALGMEVLAEHLAQAEVGES